MRVVKAEVIANRKKGIDIKFSNGMRDFIASIDKEELTIEDIRNSECYVKVFSMIRNCCAAYPANVLETGINESDDKEIKELLNDLVKKIGEEDLKKILKFN